MSHGNALLGTQRGKLGDIVFTRLNGKSVQRTRVVPSNPKSEAQCKQRMVLHTLSTAASRFKVIVDHSFEGVKYGQTSTNHFIRINTAAARAKALYDGSQEIPTGVGMNFAIKGANYLALQDYKLSSGQLSFPKVTAMESGGSFGHAIGIAIPFSAINVSPTCAADYEACLAALSCVPGDQLSIVATASNGETAAQYDPTGAYAYEQYVEVARIVFKNSADIDFSAAIPFLVAVGGYESGFQINPALANLERTSSWVGNVVLGKASTIGALPSSDAVVLSVDAGSLALTGLGIIRSQRGATGWLRSTAKLFVFEEQDATADMVWPSYANQSSEATSTRYLNQPTNRPNQAPAGQQQYAPSIVLGDVVTFNESGGTVIMAGDGYTIVNVPMDEIVGKLVFGSTVVNVTPDADESLSWAVSPFPDNGDSVTITLTGGGVSASKTYTRSNP